MSACNPAIYARNSCLRFAIIAKAWAVGVGWGGGGGIKGITCPVSLGRYIVDRYPYARFCGGCSQYVKRNRIERNRVTRTYKILENSNKRGND